MKPVLMRQREGKPGGGKGPLMSEDISLTLATANDQVLFQDVPVAYSIREDGQANTFSATPIETARALQAHQPSVQSHHAQTFIVQEADVETPQVETVVRRLTPTECERLQGFPDGWTSHRVDFKTGNIIPQADSSRYKQMGNAVAVPVVAWLFGNLVRHLQDNQ